MGDVATQPPVQFYRFTIDPFTEGAWLLNFPRTVLGRLQAFALKRGLPPEPPATVQLDIVKQGKPLDISFPTTAAVPILSTAACRVFEKFASDGIELIPVRVGDAENFWALGVRILADCDVAEQSESWDYQGDESRRIVFKAVIDRSRAGAARLFRVAPHYIVVAREVVDAVRDSGLTGAAFEELDSR